MFRLSKVEEQSRLPSTSRNGSSDGGLERGVIRLVDAVRLRKKTNKRGSSSAAHIMLQ